MKKQNTHVKQGYRKRKPLIMLGSAPGMFVADDSYIKLVMIMKNRVELPKLKNQA